MIIIYVIFNQNIIYCDEMYFDDTDSKHMTAHRLVGQKQIRLMINFQVAHVVTGTSFFAKKVTHNTVTTCEIG